MLYLVSAVLGVCCTWCMLHSLLTHDDGMGEIERDELTLCSCDDGRVVDDNERDGEWR